MNNSLSHKAKLNALSSYFNFVVSSSLAFFINPFLVKYLGSSDFGIWKACQKYLDFASIADGRASQALKWVIANHEGAESSTKEKQQAVGSAVYIWLCFSPLLLLIVGIIVYFLPQSIKGLPDNYDSMIRVTGAMLGLNILLNPLLGIPDAILVGLNQAHKSTSTQTLWLIVANFLMLLVAIFGYGLMWMASVMVIVTFLKGISVLIICRKSTPWFGIQKPFKHQTNQFISFSFWVLIWSFIARLLLSSETLLLSFLSGPTQVSNYVFSSYAPQLAISIAMITSSAVIPGLGGIMAKGNIEKSRQIISLTREVVFFIAILFGAIIIAFNQSFVTLWMGTNFYVGTKINLMIVLLMIQLIILRNEGQIQDVTLKIRGKVLSGAFGSFLSIILSIIFFYTFENPTLGLFFGLFIGRLVLTIIFPIMVNKISGNRNILTFYQPIGIVILYLSYLASIYCISTNWLILIVKFATFLIVITAISFVLLLKKNTKKLIINKIIR